jgi:hypothetical protein
MLGYDCIEIQLHEQMLNFINIYIFFFFGGGDNFHFSVLVCLVPDISPRILDFDAGQIRVKNVERELIFLSEYLPVSINQREINIYSSVIGSV